MAERLTRVQEVWISNPGPVKSYTVLHRFLFNFCHSYTASTSIRK